MPTSSHSKAPFASTVMTLPVAVSVRLPAQQITIGDALRLSPGSIILLGELDPQAVTLEVEGQVLATGVYVTVDHCRAIQVQHFSRPAPHQPTESRRAA